MYKEVIVGGQNNREHSTGDQQKNLSKREK